MTHAQDNQMAANPVDVQLLEGVMAKIEQVARLQKYDEAHYVIISPEYVGDAWSQGSWRASWRNCGTAMCFAGWTPVVDGVPYDSDDPSENAYEFVGGEHVSHWAAKRLRLSVDQRGVLFSAGNTLDDLRMLVDAIKEGADGDEVWGIRANDIDSGEPGGDEA